MAYAAYGRRNVALMYCSLTDEKKKEQVFAPYAVYFDPEGGMLKTLGVDSRRSGIISLSIDHIEQIELANETFDRPADFSLKQDLDNVCARLLGRARPEGARSPSRVPRRLACLLM
ncbi:MAG: WYL domain-containing protein [Chloracidobacterium sp.]|nr:WYL domain-containing protein [Chloracidobacterium validum]